MSGKDAAQPPVRQTIVQLLSHMRDGKEIREYLHRFSGVDQERFAVIKVGGAVIQDDLDGLASALAFLQTVGLTPVVVHGGGPQLDAALDAAGIATERINGLRVTREPAIPIIRDTLTEANLALVDAIRAAGGRAEHGEGPVPDRAHQRPRVVARVARVRRADAV